MPFITQSKTKLKYILIIFLLIVSTSIFASVTYSNPTISPSSAAELKTIKDNIIKKGAKWTANYNTIFNKTIGEKRKLLGLKEGPPQNLSSTPKAVKSATTSTMKYFDWTTAHGKNYITPIRDQDGCGSCWAHAAVAVLEGKIDAYYNDPNPNLNLSEQDLVSCANPNQGLFGGGGCSGATVEQIEQIFSNYFQTTGLTTESYFPYTASDEPCSDKHSGWQSEAWKIDSYKSVPLTTDGIKNAVVTQGPVEVGMAVYDDFFAYSGGIYQHTSTNIVGYHAVTIVGFGTIIDSGTEKGYWIVKNSWGTGWGENGYFRIAFGDSNIDNWFAYAAGIPISPTSKQVICTDDDHDGYCNWGLGSKPSSGCPSCSNTIEDCDDSNSTIYQNCTLLAKPVLLTRGLVNGIIDIKGSVLPDSFSSYILEYKNISDVSWTQLKSSNVLPVNNIILGSWDTSFLTDGQYSLRLKEIFTSGSSSYDISKININNIVIESPKNEDLIGKKVDINGIFHGGIQPNSFELKYALESSPNTWGGITPNSISPRPFSPNPENCCNNIDDNGNGMMNGADPTCQVDTNLNSGLNNICWWSDTPYHNDEDYYSGWFSCPAGYIVDKVNIEQYLADAGSQYLDWFHIYNASGNEIYKDTGDKGNVTIDLSSYKANKVIFRFTSDYAAVDQGVKVYQINCKSAAPSSPNPENCCNNIDDNGNGMMNGADPTCQVDTNLNSGLNNICWWSDTLSSPPPEDYHSGWFSCPAGYIVDKVNITDALGALRIDDPSGNEIVNLGSGTINLWQYNIRKIKFRLTEQPLYPQDPIKVNQINCANTSLLPTELPLNLASWDMSSLTMGRYLVKLTATYTDGHTSENKIVVNVDTDLHEGWPREVNIMYSRPLILTDIYGDGYKEILVRDTYGAISFYHNGTIAHCYGIPAELCSGSTLSTSPSIKTSKNISWEPSNYFFLPSPASGDVDNDGNQEIFSGEVNEIDAWKSDGSNFGGWPVGVDQQQAFYRSYITLEDLNHDGKLEVIFNDGMNYDRVGIKNYDGTALSLEKSINDQLSGKGGIGLIAIGDVDNDGNKEIVIPQYNTSGYLVWPHRYSDNIIHVFKNDGTEMSGFPINYRTNTPDEIDCQPELKSIILANLNNDGKLEILAAGCSGILIIDPSTATTKFIDPPTLLTTQDQGMAVGDINNDGFPEIVYFADHTFFVLDNTGSLLWSKHYNGYGNNIVIGDVDGDNYPDIVFATDSKKLYAFNYEGDVINGYPKYIPFVYPFSAIGDLDKNGKNEIVVIWGGGGIVYNTNGNASAIEWPMDRNDARNTASYSRGLCTTGSSECNGKKAPFTKWCDSNVLKSCNATCQYSEVNCASISGYTCHNNKLCTCVEDVNGSLLVDMKDITVIIKKFGCKYTQACYDSNADIVYDGIIDMKDINKAILNYGKSCTAFSSVAIRINSLLASLALQQISTPFFYFLIVMLIAWIIVLICMRDPKKAIQKIFSLKVLLIIILITLLLIGLHQYILIKKLTPFPIL
jgi:hypothetical protein